MLSKAKQRIIAVLTVISIIFCIPIVHADTTGEIQSFYVDSTGTVEIIGYFANTTQTDATLLLTDTDDMAVVESNFNEHLMYIDQIPLGNNGTFYFRFPISDKFSGKPYYLKIGGGDLILKKSGTLREIPSKIYNVSNNSLRVGNDVYNIGCASYTPDNISASIARGGNKVYYKIGDNWFDMLNKNATNTAYFTKDNAIPDEEWDTWEIDIYYQF